MKFAATFLLTATVWVLLAPGVRGGGAIVLYFDANLGDEAAAAVGQGGAKLGGSGQAAGIVGGGGSAARLSASALGGISGAIPGDGIGAGQAGNGGSLAADSSEDRSSRDSPDDQPSTLEDSTAENENENLLVNQIETFLNTPGVIDEYLIDGEDLAIDLQPSTPPVVPSDVAIDPESITADEVAAEPFPTTLPSLTTPRPAETLVRVPTTGTSPVDTPTATIGVPPSIGPGVEDTLPTTIIPSDPVYAAAPIIGPEVSPTPVAMTSTPEPSSATVWLLGAAAIVGIRRRSRSV